MKKTNTNLLNRQIKNNISSGLSLQELENCAVRPQNRLNVTDHILKAQLAGNRWYEQNSNGSLTSIGRSQEYHNSLTRYFDEDKVINRLDRSDQKSYKVDKIDSPLQLSDVDQKIVRPMIEAIGGTLINRLPYVQMYKQSLKRYSLLSEIRSYHDAMGSFTPEMQLIYRKHSEFVSFVVASLDINNTADHRTNLVADWAKYIKLNPENTLRSELRYEKPPRFDDMATQTLKRAQMKSRAAYQKQRIQNEIAWAHENGWYMVFDTLTLADWHLNKFYEDERAIRDYTRKVARMVNVACGRKAGDSYQDVYQYICVPEYGTKNGRLHFHILHCMKELPLGQNDPNYGLPAGQRVYRELDTMHIWKYSMYDLQKPIAVRYQGDAFTNRGWLMPIDTKKCPISGDFRPTGKKLDLKPVAAVGHYISKYIGKQTDQDYVRFGLGDTKWNQRLRAILNRMPKHVWKLRASLKFGTKLPSMGDLSTDSLIEMTKLHWSVSPVNKLLKKKAQRELLKRLDVPTVAMLPSLLPTAPNLLKSLRDSMKSLQTYNPQNFGLLMIPNMTRLVVSNETREWLKNWDLYSEAKVQPKVTLRSR